MIKPIEAMMTSIQRSSPPKMARPANIPPNSQMHILITNHRSGMAKTRMSRIRNDIATNLSMSPMWHSGFSINTGMPGKSFTRCVNDCESSPGSTPR